MWSTIKFQLWYYMYQLKTNEVIEKVLQMSYDKFV